MVLVLINSVQQPPEPVPTVRPINRPLSRRAVRDGMVDVFLAFTTTLPMAGALWRPKQQQQQQQRFDGIGEPTLPVGKGDSTVDSSTWRAVRTACSLGIQYNGDWRACIIAW